MLMRHLLSVLIWTFLQLKTSSKLIQPPDQILHVNMVAHQTSWLLLAHSCSHILARTFLLANSCSHILARTFLLANSCSHILVRTLLLAHSCLHILVHTFLLAYSCSHILARKFLLAHSCSYIIARTFLLAHSSSHILPRYSLMNRYFKYLLFANNTHPSQENSFQSQVHVKNSTAMHTRLISIPILCFEYQNFRHFHIPSAFHNLSSSWVFFKIIELNLLFIESYLTEHTHYNPSTWNTKCGHFMDRISVDLNENLN